MPNSRAHKEERRAQNASLSYRFQQDQAVPGQLSGQGKSGSLGQLQSVYGAADTLTQAVTNKSIGELGNSAYQAVSGALAGAATAATTAGAATVGTTVGPLALSAISSRRFKKEIQPLNRYDVSQLLLELATVQFRYLSEDESQPIHYGLIAEEVDKILPEIVVREPDGDPAGINYAALIPLLIASVQYLQGEIEELRMEREILKGAA